MTLPTVLMPVHDPLDRETHGRHPTRLYLHHHAVDVLGREPGVVAFADALELHAQLVSEQV
ncbi:MAG TPA: hypothetical protein VGC09_13445, partial [Rhodopila sp.]